jgi:hypothetical protein
MHAQTATGIVWLRNVGCAILHVILKVLSHSAVNHFHRLSSSIKRIKLRPSLLIKQLSAFYTNERPIEAFIEFFCRLPEDYLPKRWLPIILMILAPFKHAADTIELLSRSLEIADLIFSSPDIEI